MVRTLGPWLLGCAALSQAGCYQHHTADEELLDLEPPGLAQGDGGAADGAAPDGGVRCTGTDLLSQLTCALQGGADAGPAQPSIADLITLFGGLGGLGGLGGTDAGAGAAAGQCQNATDVITQLLCSFQGGGGTTGFPRRDGGVRPGAQPPPAEPTDAGVPGSDDAGASEDAAVDPDAAAAPLL